MKVDHILRCAKHSLILNFSQIQPSNYKGGVTPIEEKQGGGGGGSCALICKIQVAPREYNTQDDFNPSPSIKSHLEHFSSLAAKANHGDASVAWLLYFLGSGWSSICQEVCAWGGLQPHHKVHKETCHCSECDCRVTIR